MFPFLFILAMEGFHVFIHRALHIGIVRGASIGFCGLPVFHLMYVEDNIFLGEWSFHNANNSIYLLRCYLFSILVLKLMSKRVSCLVSGFLIGMWLRWHMFLVVGFLLYPFFISMFHWDVICHVLLIGKVL